MSNEKPSKIKAVLMAAYIGTFVVLPILCSIVIAANFGFWTRIAIMIVTFQMIFVFYGISAYLKRLANYLSLAALEIELLGHGQNHTTQNVQKINDWIVGLTTPTQTKLTPPMTLH